MAEEKTNNEIELHILRFALENAIKHKGKASAKALTSRIFGHFPDTRLHPKITQQKINKIVEEVNSLSFEKQKQRIEEIAPGYLEELEKEREERRKELKEMKLKPLPNAVKGEVKMRFEPSPSGPLHIGHAFSLLLNSEYCRMYGGKLFIRISDTNPGNIDPDAYELIEKDAKWITKDNVKETIIQSDRMEIYYKYSLQLIEDGNAYVCTCTPEQFRSFSEAKVACNCRDLGKEDNLMRWEQMLKTLKTGDAVVRVKTSMKDPNPAMRDFPIFRINEVEHPKHGKQYRVWPLMNFSVAIDDHDLALTHVLRGKDHYDNTKRQKYIFKYLKWGTPEYIHIGMINFTDLKLSSSETRAMIIGKKFIGWDDIRLPFLQALKRRGYQPEAFVKFVCSAGTTMSDKKVSKEEYFKTIDFYNKEAIEKDSDRYFFVEDPVDIEIEGAPIQDIELDLHPDLRKGGRKFRTNQRFLISKKDFSKIKEGQMCRLMGCLNFIRRSGKLIFDSLEYEKFKQNGSSSIIHWLPEDASNVEVKVRLQNNKVITGIAEEWINNVKQGEIIQFERFSFVKLDNKEQLEFWELHR